MREAFVQALLTQARQDPNIVLVTGDLGFGVLEPFQSELPRQFINAGVAEQAMMSMAAGIASTGKRVFVYSIGNFPTFRCLEQIRNDVCLMNNPVVVVAVGAGYAYGSQGYTHHALEDVAILRSLPNMDVVVPADPIETSLLTAALSKTLSPSYLRLGKSKEQAIHLSQPTLRDGRFLQLKSGENGTIIFSGSIGKLALEAHKELEAANISVSVFSSPFISRLDEVELRDAALKGPIVTVEEHSSRGGLGSAVLEKLSEMHAIADVRIVAASQKNVSQIGDQTFLREANGISVMNIVQHFTT